MPDTDGLIPYFIRLVPQAIFGIAAFAQLFFAFILVILVLFVTVLVIHILLKSITIAIKFVKKLYDGAKAHYNRSYDCEHCISQRNHQASVEDEGPNITEEEAKDSFDQDARTIAGEEKGKGAVNIDEEANFRHRNGLLKDDRLQIIEEVEENFDEDARTIVGQETGKDSLHLNEKAKSEERNPLLRDHGQYITDEDEGYFEEDGRKSSGEGNERTSVDLNEKDYPEQR